MGILGGFLRKPSSILNPDDIDSVMNGDYDDSYDLEDAIPEHSLKIYKADHTAYSKKLDRVVMMKDAPDHAKEDFDRVAIFKN